MKTTLDIAVAETWFEGHFPGNPILPGVVQLQLVVEALARERGATLDLGGIALMRMRKIVRPGEPLRLVTESRPTNVARVELVRNGELVMNGEVRFGLSTADRTSAPPLPLLADAPSVAGLLPHQPPMRFVTHVLGADENSLACSAHIPSTCPLVAGQLAPALAAIEVAAQACALWEGVRRSRDNSRARPGTGYLVGIHDLSLFAAQVVVDTTLTATVTLDALLPPLTHYAIQVDQDERCILHGMLATFMM